ncbi:MAG: hypothetical protein LBU37_11415 [Tannerellaceae bacterium]|jgi:hypothetical protein|nr:hypothetical protein [Tannerellaceae bacterium]
MKTWRTYIILAAFALAGCSDEIPDPDPFINPVGGEEAVVLTIRFPNSGGPGTYAIDAFEENKISRLDILSFTKGTGSFLTDTLKYHIPVETDTVNGFNVDITGITKKVSVKLQNMVDPQRLVLIANLPSSLLPQVVFTKGKIMEEIVESLKFGGSTWRNNPNADTTSFPMFGQMTTFVKFHSTVTVPKDITFQMIRAVAKIDVGVDLYGTGDPALGFGSIFKINRVYVCNASDGGYVAPHDDFLVSPKDIQGADSVKIDKVNLISSDARKDSFSYEFPEPKLGVKNRLVNPIYIPESDTLKSGYKPAFLVIKAEYYDATYFYRIDFTSGDKYVPILRDHSYEINITGVRMKGYASIEEAIAAPVSRFGALALGDDDIGLKEVISSNNEYYLAVSSKNLYVDWMDQTVAVKARTSFPNGWQVSDPSGSLNFERNQSVTGRETVLDSVKFNILENKTGKPKEYTFNINAGMLTFPITVIQSPGSNSYITKPSTSSQTSVVKIPVASANVDGVDRTAGALGYDILWESITGGGLILPPTVDDGVLTVTVDALSTVGNAVVVMQGASGKILYSWHIWVTDYDPDDLATQQSNNGFIFMDRNLGHTNVNDGLFYQWGRKDPLWGRKELSGTAPAFNIDTIKPNMNYLDSAIEHPATFYAVPLTSTTYDWIGTGQNNNMWSTSDGKKGPYDPCPFGWRVPVAKDDGSGSPWDGFTSNSRNGAVYPLVGYLDAFSGKLVDVATGGGVWSASARSQQASAFTYTTGSAQRGAKFRANAYPVRCVKDVR